MFVIFLSNVFLVSASQLTIILIITAVIFSVFIGAAIIKMFKLKAESKRLLNNSAFKKDVDKSYKDFTESHLYDNKD